MNIDKYKNLTLEEYERIISQDTIIQTEREITYKGITYILDDADYYNVTRAKTILGYDQDYTGAGKNIEETKDINRGIITSILGIASILDEDILYNTETIQKK